MKLTENNVGDILIRYTDGERIMITGVTENMFHYQREGWDGLYSQDNKDIELLGKIDTVKESLQSFLSNQTYAKVMDLAETRALVHFISEDKDEKADGAHSLRLILNQKAELSKQLKKEGLERKEDLIFHFILAFNKAPENFKTFFFGIEVEKSEGDPSIYVEGKQCHTIVETRNVLRDTVKDIEEMKLPTFNDLIKSAATRNIEHRRNNNEPGRKIPNSEIYKR